MESEELIQLAAQGDLNAFNELVLQYQDQVFNLACRFVRNEDAAEDIAQEAFLLAFRKLHQFRGGSFRAWLFKIVKNLCYSELRTKRAHHSVTLEPVSWEGEQNESPYWINDPVPLPEKILEMDELHETIQIGLDTLPLNFRAAVTLVDIEELNYADAASVMGTSLGTLKSRVARGRMYLRSVLLDANAASISAARMFARAALPGEYPSR